MYTACGSCITKFIKPKNGELTAAQFEFNRQFNSVRQRVEHIIGQIKRRALFRQPFRGTYRSAITFAHIITHTVNAQIRSNGGNYDGFGNWSHFPNKD